LVTGEVSDVAEFDLRIYDDGRLRRGEGTVYASPTAIETAFRSGSSKIEWGAKWANVIVTSWSGGSDRAAFKMSGGIQET
jgi:hypothetical protein